MSDYNNTDTPFNDSYTPQEPSTDFTPVGADTDGLEDILDTPISDDEESSAESVETPDKPKKKSTPAFAPVPHNPGEFFEIPTSAGKDPVLSERDAYRVINVFQLLDSLSDSELQNISHLLEKNKDIAKQTISLVQEDPAVVKEQLGSLRVLGDFEDIARTEGENASFKVFANLSMQIANLNDSQRADFLKRTRAVIKNTDDSVEFKATRSTEDIDVAQQLFDILVQHPDIADNVRDMSQVGTKVADALGL